MKKAAGTSVGENQEEPDGASSHYVHRLVYEDDDGFFFLTQSRPFASLDDLLSFYMVSERGK